MVTIKPDKTVKTPILRCTFLRQFLDFYNKPTAPRLISKITCTSFLNVDYYMSNMHFILCSFSVLVPTPKHYSYLGRALIFQIHLDIHPGNTYDKFINYILCYVEA